LGTGSMGSAVLRGLIDSGHPVELISATTKSEKSAVSLRAMGVSALSVEQSPDANALLSGDADVVVLGVKPYQIVDVLTEIAEELPKNSVVISMAGGIELKTMASALPEHKNLIRSMPNTPAMVGQAVTGLAPHSTASADALDAAQWLFSSVGEVVKVEEQQINALSAISGSGPAWIYYIIEQWEKVAISKGFTQEQAETLVRSTLFGSAALLADSGEEPSVLRKNVTSPGGTTERIIATLDEANLEKLFSIALDAAVNRANEIAAAKD
ncbi:MAG: pyrroline-5-carboxylate reductase, partial [Actinobacteria bacterium]|nr:pyrroline-5-carboxylate reductase [Actinomycetota bacterium]